MALEVLRREPAPAAGTDENRVRWSGIFSGSFISTGLAFLFMILGSTIGLPSMIAINPMVPESINSPFPADGLFFLTWLYTLVSLVLSFFIGGYCAARISRAKDRESGTLYGLSSWAVV